jgi:AraC-like DNA-binding protein/mannose-6-phosphate isomerase-like protein (cupin superfamily)
MLDRSIDVLADVLAATRTSTLVYGRMELSAPWGLEFAADGAAHLYVVARGGGRLELAGAPPLVLSAGDVAFLPHGERHVLRDAPRSPLQTLGACRGEQTLETIRLGGGGAPSLLVGGRYELRRSPLLGRLPKVIPISAQDHRESPWLPATVQLLVAEATSDRPGGAVVVNRLADVLLVQALRTAIAGEQCAEQGLPALADPPIAHALALMHQRPAEPWTVEKLAWAVGLSRSGFAARFTALVGEPPLEYLGGWRMTKAARLLREGDDSTRAVAGHVGYRSDAAFNRAFKRWEGKGPGAYRRANSSLRNPRTR